jgi:hypothetical protein
LHALPVDDRVTDAGQVPEHARDTRRHEHAQHEDRASLVVL